MKNILSLFFIFISFSLIGQTKYIENSKGELVNYETIDTVMYFEFNDTCQIYVISDIIDSLSSFCTKVDTVFGFQFRIRYLKENKQSIQAIINSSSAIKFSSFEYLDKDSIIQWSSNVLILERKIPISIDSLLQSKFVNFINIQQDTFLSNFYKVVLPSNSDFFEISNMLFGTHLFTSVSPSFYYAIKISSLEDDEEIGQYYLNSYSEVLKGVDAYNTWEITRGNPNIKIAVLDNGVYKNHSDLSNNIIYPGYDAVDHPGISNSYGSNKVGDTHGTKVSGVMVAVDNEIGITGLANSCKVFPIRIGFTTSKNVFEEVDPENDDDFEIYWIMNAIWIEDGLNQAMNNGCSVVNGSFIIPFSEYIERALEQLSSNGRNGKGIPLVFAAGNERTSCFTCIENQNDPFLKEHVMYPAISDWTIGVGGSNLNGYPVLEFNFGEGVDLIAPAVQIYTTSMPSYQNSDLYKYCKGTSFAAPLVSATIALMLSVNPDLSYDQIKEILFKSLNIPVLDVYYFDDEFETIVNLMHPNQTYGDWNILYGYGALNAHAAVVNTVFYGESVDGNNTINLCDEAIYTLSEFDLPEWVDEVYWSVSDNLTIIEEISPLSIRVKAIGAGIGTVTYNIVHNNYTKKINKEVVINSLENIAFNAHEFEGIQSINTNSIISGVNIIKPNCILTISSQIKCTPNASIVVNPGGKLIINNGSLTNYCENFPWQGIVVEGDPNSSQVGFNPNQGTLTMNNSSISNAVCGVKVGDFFQNSKSGVL